MALVTNISPAVQNPVGGQSAFDDRLVQVDIEFPDAPLSFQNLAIFASGRKYGSPTMNECECRIYNLTKEQRNYIITKATPMIKEGQDRTPINMNLKVGRASYGSFLLFTGNVFACGISQPPDIGIVLKSLTCNFFIGTIYSSSQPALSPLSQIAKNIADSMGLTLEFQATDKQIENFAFTGNSPITGLHLLEQMGNVQAFINNKYLYVINADKAVEGDAFLISEGTGMVGIPQVTEQGVIVRVMITSDIDIGKSVTILSAVNPAANGTYKVVRMAFEIANRDQPFWFVLECSNLALYQGA